jgi:hypothetical protein
MTAAPTLLKLALTRKQAGEDGIFSDLTRADGTLLAQTLEHAYEHVPTSTPSVWEPKLPKGVYTCQRGEHRLSGSPTPFITFEIMNVPGHTGMLFHKGNFNADSDGCVLLGNSVVLEKDGKTKMLANSAQAFARFLALVQSQTTFELTVA